MPDQRLKRFDERRPQIGRGCDDHSYRRELSESATGVTYDGVAADGTINKNSGAESTIHGLLSMLALDAHPAARRIAQTAHVQAQVVDGLKILVPMA